MPNATMLRGRRAIGAAIEATEHTAESLTVSNANLRVYSPTFTVRPVQSPRNYARPSFSRPPLVPGGTAMDISFGLELGTASAGATTEPPWSKLFRACGIHYAALRSLTPGTITGGPVRHGEILIQATSGATAIAVLETATGTTTMRYELLSSGDFNTTNLVTAQGSGATFTPSAVVGSANAQAWWPTTFPSVYLTLSASSGALAVGSIVIGGSSGARGELVYYALTSSSVVAIVRPFKGQFTAEALSDAAATWTGTASAATKADAPTLTLGEYLDGKILVVRGCRGNFDVSFEPGLVPIFQMAFQGVVSTNADGANVIPTNYGTRTPAAFKSASFLIEGASTGMLFSRFSLGLGNSVVLPTSQDDTEGFSAARITDRESTITYDPEAVQASVHDVWSALRNGSRVNLNFNWGTTPNLFEMSIPAYMPLNVEDGERMGIFTTGLPGYGSAGLYGSQASVEGRDQDWILVNR